MLDKVKHSDTYRTMDIGTVFQSFSPYHLRTLHFELLFRVRWSRTAIMFSLTFASPRFISITYHTFLLPCHCYTHLCHSYISHCPLRVNRRCLSVCWDGYLQYLAEGSALGRDFAWICRPPHCNAVPPCNALMYVICSGDMMLHQQIG